MIYPEKILGISCRFEFPHNLISDHYNFSIAVVKQHLKLLALSICVCVCVREREREGGREARRPIILSYFYCKFARKTMQVHL